MALPGWLKPPPWPEAGAPEEALRRELARGRDEPIMLREVSEWDPRWQRMLFRLLLPARLLLAYKIDPVKLTDPQGRPVAFIQPGRNRSSCRLELHHSGDAADPMGEIELADTLFNQLEVLWVALQDPSSPRYGIDTMPDGTPTMRGTQCRNLIAEEAAMLAGLAPGQVRRGLGAFQWLSERVESLALCLNHHQYVVQPLFYHTAVLFEQHGFSYVQGEALMASIHVGFGTGGRLRTRLDGSSPFRRPEQAESIIGRSWAIHDGILDDPWDKIRMVKRAGLDSGVNTCPGIHW